jgi:hypothetical protein
MSRTGFSQPRLFRPDLSQSGRCHLSPLSQLLFRAHSGFRLGPVTQRVIRFLTMKELLPALFFMALLSSTPSRAACYDDPDGRVWQESLWTAYYLLASHGDKVLVLKFNEKVDAPSTAPTAESLQDEKTVFHFLEYDFRDRIEHYSWEAYGASGSGSWGVELSDPESEESAFDSEHYYRIPNLEEKGRGREIADALRRNLSACLKKTRLAKAYKLNDIVVNCERVGGFPNSDISFDKSKIPNVSLASFDGTTQFDFNFYGRGTYRRSQCVTEKGSTKTFDFVKVREKLLAPKEQK